MHAHGTSVRLAVALQSCLLLAHRLTIAHLVARALRVQVKNSLKSLMGGVHGSMTTACQEYFERFLAVLCSPCGFNLIDACGSLRGRHTRLTRCMCRSRTRSRA